MKPLSAEWYRKRAEEVRYSGKTISQYNHFLGVAEAIEQAETVKGTDWTGFWTAHEDEGSLAHFDRYVAGDR